ncbi:MAG: hypothetical protein RR336_09950, partial [Oscillospiraceae bacterium]
CCFLGHFRSFCNLQFFERIRQLRLLLLRGKSDIRPVTSGTNLRLGNSVKNKATVITSIG